jgi:hypothetical protein
VGWWLLAGLVCVVLLEVVKYLERRGRADLSTRRRERRE